MVSGQVGCLWSVEGNMKYLRDCTCDSSRDHDVTMLDISDDGHCNPFSSRMTPHTELAWPRVAVAGIACVSLMMTREHMRVTAAATRDFSSACVIRPSSAKAIPRMRR